MKNFLLISGLFILPLVLFSQSGLWKKAEYASSRSGEILPLEYQGWKLNEKAFLRQLPDGYRPVGKTIEIRIPAAGGKFQAFTLEPYSLMSPDMTEKFPQIKAWRGHSQSGDSRVYINSGTKGFHFTLIDGRHTYYIEPFGEPSDRTYLFYDIGDFPATKNAEFSCETGLDEDPFDLQTDWNPDLHPPIESTTRRGAPLELRSYRMAIASTAEFTQLCGGTKADALSIINVILTRLNSIYGNEFSFDFQLADNNDRIIYLDQFGDPYSNGTAGEMLDENQSTIDANIGPNNYEFGHVLGTANSPNGLAQLSSVCGGGRARAASLTASTLTGDPFVVNIVAHEVGHQFGASHTMYHCHNVSAATAYEPGSGSTIMSYAGICSPAQRNIQPDADPYFHANSVQAISTFSRFGNGNSCAARTSNDNTFPDIELNYPNGMYIPRQTPLRLNGSANDDEDQALTYNWEQYDIGPSDPEPILGSPGGTAPLFRSYPPDASSTRYLPDLQYLTQNEFYLFEILPAYSRTLDFRFLARDNHPGGGSISWEQVSFNVTDQAGPFRVAHPSEAGLEFAAGQTIAIDWNTAGTDTMPVNSREMEILLSVDGGFTYPYTLEYSTDNDGRDSVLLPDVRTDNARIMVAAADNIFFDISDFDFTIGPATDPGYYLNFENETIEVCLPDVLQFDFSTSSFANYSDTVYFEIIENDIPGADLRFLKSGIEAGDENSLIVDLEDVSEEGEFIISFKTTSANGVSFERSILFELISNDFSGFALISPGDGLSGLGIQPLFEWTDAADADMYFFELSSSPDFNSDLIYSESEIQNNSLQLPLELDPNTIYFWRVGYENDCQSSFHDQIFSFQTIGIDCNVFQASSGTINIPQAGINTIESPITVNGNLTIDDINIPIIRGSHANFEDLTLMLVAPDGASVLLADMICPGPSAFRFGLDDEAATPIENCQIGSNASLQPQEMISQLNDSESEGEWKLRITDNVDGDGGQLQSWSLEICADLMPNNPFLVTNDTLDVKPSKGRIVDIEFLEADDLDNPASQITYTVVKAPQKGQLLLSGSAIGTGGTFSQLDIDNLNLVYKHAGNEEESDFFTFILTDPDGGFFGTPRFDIRMDTSVNETPVADITAEIELNIYPNPSREGFWLEWSDDLSGGVDIIVYDLSGRLMKKVDRNSDNRIYVKTAGWPSGMYMLHLRTSNGSTGSKLIVD